MAKKKLLLLAAVCVLLCNLTACGKTDNDITLPENEAPPQTQTEPAEIPSIPEPADIRPEDSPEKPSEPAESEEPEPPQTGGNAMFAA